MKLEFGGESPLTMRAWCSAFRYCPDPLGIVTTEQLNKLEFGVKNYSTNSNSSVKSFSKSSVDMIHASLSVGKTINRMFSSFIILSQR